ncbi:MAG: AAA family ATPase, partial [Candidatus Bathyarchaeota archaeon]
MVHLKKLEMKGFKSFGSRRVVVDLDKGLTVVTGPNGSGKSNILDAIRFVLGDLSARSLRADKMAGVIYDGIQAPLSMASITLHLDNNERRIAVDTDVVTITRRVDRAGESEYALNGRHVPRGQLVDILRMAGLSSSGYNMIMQGTITRLADITPEERRKAIEDLVGIAEYDAKKTDARIQLQQADVNLRIASARIGDVQSRLERLEEERNDALRYNFIQSEMNKLQATILSYRLLNLQSQKTSLADKLKEKYDGAGLLRRQYDQLLDERNGVESARRKFDEEIVDKGNIRLIALQKTTGDLMASIAGLKMEIDSGGTSLKTLQQIYKDRVRQLEVLEPKIRESQQSLSKQKAERDKLQKFLDEKNASYSTLSSKVKDMKLKLETNTADINKIEDILNGLRRQTLKLNTRLQGYSVRQRILADSLKTFKERRDSFELTLKDLQKHFTELQKLQESERENLERLSGSVNKDLSKKEAWVIDLNEAEKTVKTANDTVVEFEAQKSLAERLTTEEASLQKIEEMGKVGAISGILGRTEALIKTDPKFQKAIEAV